jgi:hypothetical protein
MPTLGKTSLIAYDEIVPTETMVNMLGRWPVYIAHEDTGERKYSSARKLDHSAKIVCTLESLLQGWLDAEHAAGMARITLAGRRELY